MTQELMDSLIDTNFDESMLEDIAVAFMLDESTIENKLAEDSLLDGDEFGEMIDFVDNT